MTSASPAGPARPDSEPRPFADLRTSGLLWLINRVALHPRGLALALHYDDAGEPHGWSLLTNDEGEPWQFDPTTDHDGYKRSEATLADAISAATGGIVSTPTNIGETGCALAIPYATPRTDTVRTPRPDTRHRVRTSMGTDTYPQALTSTDTVRTPCPDSSTDNPSGIQMLYNARVPRAQMGAAWAEGLAHLQNLLAKGQADAADQPDQDTPAGQDLTLGPDGLTDTERERKTIREVIDTELYKPDERAANELTSALSHALQAMPRYAGTAAQEAAPANDEHLGTPENAHIRLGLARQVLVDDGYFTDDEVGPDLAPRLVEWLSHHRGLADTARKEVDVLRARVGELADTLAEAIGRFTVAGTAPGSATVCTSAVPAATVERWRRIHTGKGPTGWMFPPVHGRCPACNRGSLFLGSGGYVTCSHTDCTNPVAPTELLDNHEALTEAEERARRHALAYEGLRCDVITAAAYIRQQKDRVGPFSSLRHSRTRILTVLPNWVKDPGPLDPQTTPTEAQ